MIERHVIGTDVDYITAVFQKPRQALVADGILGQVHALCHAVLQYTGSAS